MEIKRKRQIKYALGYENCKLLFFIIQVSEQAGAGK
jgi:hypothetical protein